jgi:hypothetical protein
MSNDLVDPGAAGRRRRGAAALRRAAPWMLLALFLPVAMLGLVILPNEYERWGGGGVDCDGPMLLVFAIPAAVACSLLALVFIRRAVRRRSWVPALAALVCAVLVPPLVANIHAARAEQTDPDYQQVCEA